MDKIRPWHVPGKWYAVPSYWEADVIKRRPNRFDKINMIDCTLAEGEDCTGCHLGWAKRIEIASALDELGVGAITIPEGADDKEQRDFIRWCKTHNIKARICSKGPSTQVPLPSNWKDMYRRHIELGGDFIVPIIPGSSSQRRQAVFSDYTTGITKETMVEVIQEITSFAKEEDAEVVISIGDSMRTELNTVLLYYRMAVEAGADGIYVWVSRGNSHPSATAYYVSRLRETIGNKDFYIQFHNDLGMATGNSMIAVENGANWIDVSVLGIADRGGCVPLEEVASALTIYGVETGIKLEKLFQVCKLVEDAFNITVQPWKPIAGKTWPTEPGWGHRVAGDPPETPMGIAPELVGRVYENVVAPTIFFGRYPSFITDLLNIWGYKYTENDLNEIIERTKSSIMAGHRYISQNELKEICKGVLYIP